MARRKESESSQDILAAAEEVFAREGLHGAKVGDIAKHAGVAVGTLYNYFSDRDALVHALLEARSASLRERMETAIAGEGDFVADLRTVVAALLEWLHKNRRFVSLMAQSEMLAHAPGSKGKPITSVLARENLERLARLMDRGIAQGVLRPGASRLYGMMLMSLVRSVALAPQLGADDLADVSAEELTELFLHGTGELLSRPG
jgi:AcrR family transcriptional regulator